MNENEPRCEFPVDVYPPDMSRLKRLITRMEIQRLRFARDPTALERYQAREQNLLQIRPGQALRLRLEFYAGEWHVFWHLVNALGVPLEAMNFEPSSGDSCWAYLHPDWVPQYMVLARLRGWEDMIQGHQWVPD